MEVPSGATSFFGDGLLNWDMSRVTDLRRTFSLCTSFTGNGLVNWDVSGVTSLYETLCDLVHGRWIVKLGYIECDEFVRIQRYDLVHENGVSNWYVG